MQDRTVAKSKNLGVGKLVALWWAQSARLFASSPPFETVLQSHLERTVNSKLTDDFPIDNR